MMTPTDPAASGPEDQRLLCEVVDGRLLISIGIKILAWAYENDLADASRYDTDDGSRLEYPKIINVLEFAKDVKRAFEDEREDGSSLLTDAIDKACKAAVDDGSLGIAFDAEDENDDD